MRLIKALVAMVVGLVVLVVAAALLLPTDRIANIAARQFEAATGRSLHFGGEVVPSFYPVIGATAQDVRIGNPAWAGAGPMLTAGEMDIGLNVMALIRGDIVVERVVLQSPDLHLIRDAQGRMNWNFAENAPPASATAGAASDAPARSLSLAEARIVNGALRFEDAQSGTDLRISALEGVLRLPDARGPATLSAAGQANGQPFDIAFQTQNAARLLSGAVTPVGLEGTLAGAAISFGGRMGLEDMALEGQLDARIPALRPLLQLVGQTGGEMAAEYLPLGLRGQVTRAADGRLFAREAQFQAGGVRLAGDLDLVPGGERPRVTGQLSGDVIDLRRQSRAARAQPAQSGQGGASGWSRDAIDASALGLIDADISLALAGLRTDGLSLGRTRFGLAIDRARAVFDLRDVALFGGQVTGEFVMNNRAGLSVGGDLRLRDIDLLSVLTEMADYRRLQGLANLDLQFLGVGNTLHDIMNSLRGSGRLAFSEGEIIGFDLAGMLRNLDMSYMGEGNRTIYQALNGTFTISEGVLRNEDMRLEASRFSVTGRGAVGIGARNLDYRIVPTALRDDDTLRVPLMITGPWDAPRFRLDMESLAREQLRVEQERLEDIAREEARRLEERARSAAETRLERELGVQREEGERAEDTLRRGVEQELGRRLRGLLGGD